MNRVVELATILFLLAALAIGAYVIWYVKSLQDQTEALHIQVDVLRREQLAAQVTLEAARHKLDRLQTAQAIAILSLHDVNTTIMDNSHACEHANARLGPLLKQMDQKGIRTSDILNIVEGVCQLSDARRQQAMDDFLPLYSDAVVARINDDFRKSFTLYEKATQVQGFDAIDGEWQARALEGLSYSSFQLGDLPDAESAVKKSLGITENGQVIGRTYAFARLTAIKIDCKRAAPQDAIRRQLDTLRSEMKALALNGAPVNRYYYNLYASAIEEDRELFSICSYAGIKPMPPS